MEGKSKYLSWVLRHGLMQVGLTPDSDGYVKLENLLKISNGKLTKTETLEIVKNCPKQRFSIKTHDDELYIRANQGHSKKIGDLIESEELLTKLDTPIDGVFHGSYMKHLDSIKSSGLNRMSRKHIHLAKSIDAKSGKRNNCNLLVYVDMSEAMKDGITFYESSNGVILTEGIDGIIPSKYLKTQLI
jgi:RNA:NAD 2'-phosphotransferase (TPT1/KptA family)